MPPIKSLLSKVKSDFPGFIFSKGVLFKWSPATKQITYTSLQTPEDAWNLLHELSHAELGHYDYELDIELLLHEAAAWERAKEIAPRYGFELDEGYVQDNLDSYRRWMHTRSSCPDCGQNGLQTTQNTYRCVNCRCLWRVNDARVCQLRRVKITQQSS